MVEARTYGALNTIGMALAFIVLMLVVGRPAMVRLTLHYGNRGLSQGLMAAIFVALLVSALTTDLIGIHGIFGAFALARSFPTIVAWRGNSLIDLRTRFSRCCCRPFSHLPACGPRSDS